MEVASQSETFSKRVLEKQKQVKSYSFAYLDPLPAALA
jgi:hypothetical protein